MMQEMTDGLASTGEHATDDGDRERTSSSGSSCRRLGYDANWDDAGDVLEST